MTPPTIPFPPSPDTLDLLIRAKSLLEHAIGHSTSPSGVDPIIVVHGLDNSIEYLARIIARHIDYELITGDSLEKSGLLDIIAKLNKHTKATYSVALPHIEDIRVLRQARNLVQHAAIDVAKDLAHFVRITQRFFEAALPTIFGLQADRLSISQLIQNNQIRQYLEESETKLKSGQFLESVEAARDAYENAYLQHLAGSRLRSSAPAAVSLLRSTNPEESYLMEALVDELQALRLGVNPVRLDRFRGLLDHIPHDRRIDERGNIVLMRPWLGRDAQFCLSFASEYALKWQLDALEPLYSETRAIDEYRIDEYVDDEPIENELGLDCKFGGLDGRDGQLWYVDEATIAILRNLKVGQTYRWSSTHYKNDALSTKISYEATLTHFHFKVATTRPKRWEVFLWRARTPFTWHRDDFVDGQRNAASIDLNRADSPALCTLYPIDEGTAAKVIALRTALGAISSREQLEGISGITKLQLDWLTMFTHL
jgi:hypothetical protein